MSRRPLPASAGRPLGRSTGRAVRRILPLASAAGSLLPLLPLLAAGAQAPATPDRGGSVTREAAAAKIAAARGAQGSALPAGWLLIADGGSPRAPRLEMPVMAPGWHLNGGAGGVATHPDHVARGRDAAVPLVASELFLFARAPESGAGVAVGVRPDAWTALVVGPDGRFAILRRAGGAVRPLVPWTAHAAVARHPGGEGVSAVRERLAVTLVGDSVRFLVNDAAVATLPRAVVAPEGAVGLRAQPAANVHVATFLVDGWNVAPVATAGQPGH